MLAFLSLIQDAFNTGREFAPKLRVSLVEGIHQGIDELVGIYALLAERPLDFVVSICALKCYWVEWQRSPGPYSLA